MKALTVAVVGAGFAGTYFVDELRRLRRRAKRPLKVLLFDPKECFVFTPLLPEVATASMDLEQVMIDIDRLFGEEAWVRHVQHAVTNVDLKKRRVTADKAYHYDYLVLATGAETNYFGNEELRKRTLTLKTGEDAHAIRYALEQAVVDAAKVRDATLQKERLRVTIVGGGPTGVELAAETKQFLKQRTKEHKAIQVEPAVRLVQAAPAILPMASPRVQETAMEALERLGVDVRTCMRVGRVEPGLLHCDHKAQGRMTLDSNITVWVAGVRPRVPAIPGHDGVVPIKRTLQYVGDEHVFAIGDVAQLDPEYSQERLPALAQVAVQAGPFAARNLVRHINERPLCNFEYRSKGFLVSLGQKNAAAELVTPVGTIFLRGFIAWWLWRTIYLFKFLDAKHQFRVMLQWTRDLFRGRRPSSSRTKT